MPEHCTRIPDQARTRAIRFQSLLVLTLGQTENPQFSLQSEMNKKLRAKIWPIGGAINFFSVGLLTQLTRTKSWLARKMQVLHKLTWLVLGGDPAARSHRVEQFTARL